MASRTDGIEDLLRRDAELARAEVDAVDVDALLQRVIADLNAERPEHPGLSQQLSPETVGETPAAASVWQATVRDGADVVLTDEGPLLQVLSLAVVIGQFWPALRVCVRRQQHRSPRPESAA